MTTSHQRARRAAIVTYTLALATIITAALGLQLVALILAVAGLALAVRRARVIALEEGLS
jgi:hypothetical protein